MSGARELEMFIAAVERVRSLNEDVAKEAAPAVAKVIRSNAARGVAPDGTKWPELKKGGQALKDAPSAVTSRNNGGQVVISIPPPYAYHNFGTGDSPRRQILPDGGETLPDDIRAAVQDAAAKVFQRTMGGK